MSAVPASGQVGWTPRALFSVLPDVVGASRSHTCADLTCLVKGFVCLVLTGQTHPPPSGHRRCPSCSDKELGWQESDKAMGNVLSLAYLTGAISPWRSASRSSSSSLWLAGTCCPSAWLPVSILGPAGRWVVGVEDELSPGERLQGPWAGQELGINSSWPSSEGLAGPSALPLISCWCQAGPHLPWEPGPHLRSWLGTSLTALGSLVLCVGGTSGCPVPGENMGHAPLLLECPQVPIPCATPWKAQRAGVCGLGEETRPSLSLGTSTSPGR